MKERIGFQDKMVYRKLLLISFILLNIVSFHNFLFPIVYLESQNQQFPHSMNRYQIDPTKFNASNAYSLIEEQIDLGYRIPGTEAHQNFIEWVQLKVHSYGVVQRINFTINEIECSHILLKINPGQQKILSFGAHFDTRAVAEKDPDSTNHNTPIDGANDGASGVAVLIEMARVLSNPILNLTCEYWFLFIDAEDQGRSRGMYGIEGWDWCEGSQWLASDLEAHPEKYFQTYQSLSSIESFILLDMVGGSNLEFIRERNANSSLEDALFLTGQDLGYSAAFPENAQSYSIIDDHVYIGRTGIPVAVLVIKFWDTDNGWPYHHTQSDNIDNIDIQSLEITGTTVLEYIRVYHESGENGIPIDEDNWITKLSKISIQWKITFISMVFLIGVSGYLGLFLHSKYKK